MPSRHGQKSEDRTGKIYRVRSVDNLKTKPGYMQGRLTDGDLVLCLERTHARVYRYAPLWIDEAGVKVYPEAFWFLSEPIGEVLTSWQPTAAQHHQLWGALTLKGLPLSSSRV